MGLRLGSWLTRPQLLRTVITSVRLSSRLLRDPQVPARYKALALLPLVYIVSPVDLLPDLVPVLGQLDDVAVALLAAEFFVGLCPPAVVAHHREALAAGRRYSPKGPEGQVIDAEFTREGPD